MPVLPDTAAVPPENCRNMPYIWWVLPQTRDSEDHPLHNSLRWWSHQLHIRWSDSTAGLSDGVPETVSWQCFSATVHNKPAPGNAVSSRHLYESMWSFPSRMGKTLPLQSVQTSLYIRQNTFSSFFTPVFVIVLPGSMPAPDLPAAGLPSSYGNW